jgi:hypothetical protein
VQRLRCSGDYQFLFFLFPPNALLTRTTSTLSIITVIGFSLLLFHLEDLGVQPEVLGRAPPGDDERVVVLGLEVRVQLVVDGEGVAWGGGVFVVARTVVRMKRGTAYSWCRAVSISLEIASRNCGYMDL